MMPSRPGSAPEAQDATTVGAAGLRVRTRLQGPMESERASVCQLILAYPYQKNEARSNDCSASETKCTPCSGFVSVIGAIGHVY